MKDPTARGPRILLPLSAVLVCALAGSAIAGSIPAPLLMPPVGPAARSTMPDAPGTITTPRTPTVPPSPTPGKSTITIPGASRSGLPSTANPATVRPCGKGSSAAGAVGGNAGIFTSPGANNDATGVPNIPSGGSDAGAPTTTNPSVRPGVPSTC